MLSWPCGCILDFLHCTVNKQQPTLTLVECFDLVRCTLASFDLLQEGQLRVECYTVRAFPVLSLPWQLSYMINSISVVLGGRTEEEHNGTKVASLSLAASASQPQPRR